MRQVRRDHQSANDREILERRPERRVERVRYECGEYALRIGEKFGIWGGASEIERRQMRKERAAAWRRVA